jgi:hypothetical protein
MKLSLCTPNISALVPTICVLGCLLLLGCNKNEPEAYDGKCYKATLIANDCAYIVKVEGVNIGENWHGIKNCVSVTHLPSDAQTIGSTLYFTSYAPGIEPYCTFERISDYPKKFIELLNYSKTKCP